MISQVESCAFNIVSKIYGTPRWCSSVYGGRVSVGGIGSRSIIIRHHYCVCIINAIDEISSLSSSSAIVSVKFWLRIATHVLLTDFLCCCAGATKYSTVKTSAYGLLFMFILCGLLLVRTRRTYGVHTLPTRTSHDNVGDFGLSMRFRRHRHDMPTRRRHVGDIPY